MKKLFNILKSTSLLLVLAFLMSSCLKANKATYFDFASSETTVELPLAAYDAKQVKKIQGQEFIASATPTDLPVVINIASPKTLSKALTVVLGVNAADALNKFNTANGTTYVLLPSNAYSAVSLSANIPSGQRIGTVTFKINTAVVGNIIKNYILPVSIVDAGGEKISNYNTVYYNISVK